MTDMTIQSVALTTLDSILLDCRGLSRSAYGGLQDAQTLCHTLAARSGWWTDPKTNAKIRPDATWVLAKLALVHSEVSEATEGARKDVMDDHLPHRKMLEVELADAVIRILDLAGGLGLDVAGAMVEKLAYNQRRADHRLESRNKAGGKSV